MYNDSIANTNQKDGDFSPFKRKLNISNDYKEVRFSMRRNTPVIEAEMR